MSVSSAPEPIDAAIAEYLASFESFWKPKTLTKYEAELRGLRAWLAGEGRPLTTASLDFATLLAYASHLKAKPVARGVWRGDAAARATATTVAPRSLNSVNSSMRAIQGFVRWLFEDGRLAADPYGKKYRRGRIHPLLPRAVTPTKGAALDDFVALERGCAGRSPLDLRDQAIVAIFKSTAARNSAVRMLRLEHVDLERNDITLPPEKGDTTYKVALVPEAKAAVVRYLHRGRPKLLPRYPVRGLESLATGDDPGYLFISRDNGRADGVVGDSAVVLGLPVGSGDRDRDR
jgi:integrase